MRMRKIIIDVELVFDWIPIGIFSIEKLEVTFYISIITYLYTNLLIVVALIIDKINS
jgi:hypothetical protein